MAMQKTEIAVSFVDGIGNRGSEFQVQKLQAATNSCLTETPGEVSRPTALAYVGTVPVARAVAVSARAGNIAVYPGADDVPYLVSQTQTQPLRSANSPTSQQNVWRPWQVDHANTPFRSAAAGYYSTVCETSGGNIVMASLRYDAAAGPASQRIIITATDQYHRVVLQPTVLAIAGGMKLTAHGGDACLTYYTISGNLVCQMFSWTGTTFTPGALHTIAAIAINNDLLPFAAASGGASPLYLVYAATSPGTTVTVVRINTGTFTTGWTNTYTTERASTAWFPSIDAAGTYLAVAWTDTGSTTTVVLNTGNGATIRAKTNHTGAISRRVAVFVAFKGANIRTVLAFSAPSGALASPQATIIRVEDLASATPTQHTLYASVLMCQDAAAVYDGSDRLPVFLIGHMTDLASATDLTSAMYVTDPSLELYQTNQIDGVGPNELWSSNSVARLGVDRAYLSGLAGLGASNTTSVHVVFPKDGRLAVEYNKCTYGISSPVRCVVAGDVTIVAAAQPVVWDGVETVELGGPLHIVTLGSAGGTAGSTGVKYRAVVTWRDSQGNLHRSAPSSPNPAGVTTFFGAGTGPTTLNVSIPDTFKQGYYQDWYGVEIYVASNSDPRYFLLIAANANTATVGNTYSIPTPPTAVNTSFPLLYSDGSPLQELVPEAPPAMWDVAMVSGRVWYIDATRRNVAGHSKPQQDGVSPEFNSVNRTVFPAEAGLLIAVQDMGGVPVFFAERGVYVILGDGPDALGTGAFSPPRLAATCQPHPDSRNVTVRCPTGIFFRTKRSYAMLAPDYGIKYLDDLEEPDNANRSTAVVLEASHEIALVTSGDQNAWAVYNYNADAWTTWDYTATLPGGYNVYSATAVYDPASHEDRLFVFSTAAVHSGGKHTSGELNKSWEVSTAWIQPNDLGGRISFSEVLFYFAVPAAMASGSVTLKIFYDYELAATPAAGVAVTAAQATLETVGNLCVLRVKAARGSARALRLSVSSDSATPLNLHPIKAIVRLVAEPGSNVRSSSTVKG